MNSDINEVIAWVYKASLLNKATDTIANEALSNDTNTWAEVVSWVGGGGKTVGGWSIFK